MTLPTILYRGQYIVPDAVQATFRPGGGGVTYPRHEPDVDVEAVWYGGQDITKELERDGVLRDLELDLLDARNDAYADHYLDQREDR